ncbi:MAG: molybdenum cofactor guanylyltransferase [Anaerolineae bacterium]|nr:molybdenum cofactor guanylyltransferase [Anaerolineae bacterium]
MTPVSVAIQAGGQSSRMGTDKSFVLYNGRSMIETVLAQVADLGQETFIVTNNPEPYAYLGVPTVADIFPDHGPLGGIHTAISHASHAHTLIVACDMPWLKRPLLQHLISLRETADVIVPRWDKFPEPLHAVYSKACLPPIEANLQAKQLKITRFYGQVTVRYVDKDEIEEFDENGRSFANINTPQELTQVQKNSPD